MEAVKGARINRYIVGCKAVYDESIPTPANRINRYIVGCKGR